MAKRKPTTWTVHWCQTQESGEVMAKRKLCPYTLRSVARRTSAAQRRWSKSRRFPAETYGSGFDHGMAEMARRITVDCRDRAKSLERKPKKPTGGRDG